MSLKSERTVIAAPLSFAGSTGRLYYLSENIYYRILLMPLLIMFSWSAVLLWYSVFGLWLLPYRIFRRSQRKQKRDKQRHRELVDAVASHKVGKL